MRLRLLRLVPLGALLLVMGCSQKITVCPVPAILADTQSVTIFRPGTRRTWPTSSITVALINARRRLHLQPRTPLVHRLDWT